MEYKNIRFYDCRYQRMLSYSFMPNTPEDVMQRRIRRYRKKYPECILVKLKFKQPQDIGGVLRYLRAM